MAQEGGGDDSPVRDRFWKTHSGAVIIAATVTAVGAILAAIIGAAVVTYRPNQSPTPVAIAPSTRPTAPPSPGPTANGRCTKKLIITSPVSGQIVSNGALGVVVMVRACGLTGDTGWLFDYDPRDLTYTLDGTAPYRPVAGGDGTFSFDDQPIGDQGDTSTTHTVVLVQATASCAAELAAKSGDVRLTSLPKGCDVADKVDVLVTYP
jgi:hypothetical protein